jgi:hypothetical protein
MGQFATSGFVQSTNPNSEIIEKMAYIAASNLEASYDVVYEQIKELPDETRTIAQNTIRWLLCSKQQLQSSELIAAVYMSLDRELLDDEDYDFITADGLLDFCCNLVVLDKSLDTFRMAHLSVREYFEKVTG